MTQNIAEERGSWERGEGKGSGNGVVALSAASMDSEDPAAMPGDRDLLSLWA